MKLDIGCGKNKREGFLGVDVIPFDTVDLVMDVNDYPWSIPVSCHEKLSDENKSCWSYFRKTTATMLYDFYELKPDSVEEVHCSHFVEHLTGSQRIAFVNELYRVLKPGGTCTITVPHWASCRAYGDMTHQWPPVSEFWFYYLSKEWRSTQAPHDDILVNPRGYACDFNATWGYAMNDSLRVRNPEFQQHAMSYYKEAITDMIATLTKPKPPEKPNV